MTPGRPTMRESGVRADVCEAALVPQVRWTSLPPRHVVYGRLEFHGSRTTSTEQARTSCATRSLTLPSERKPRNPRLPTTTRLAPGSVKTNTSVAVHLADWGHLTVAGDASVERVDIDLVTDSNSLQVHVDSRCELRRSHRGARCMVRAVYSDSDGRPLTGRSHRRTRDQHRAWGVVEHYRRDAAQQNASGPPLTVGTHCYEW